MSRGSANTTRPSGLGTSVNGGSPSIPPSAKKVIQSLKEIVSNSDDEIYAALKECNMDPNETVQRLLSQDPFHEVKRKKDKKKEAVSNRDSIEPRGRGSNYTGRGGRGSGTFDRGPRTNFPSKYTPSDSVGGGRGRPLAPHGNGILGSRATSGPTTGILGSPAIQQSRAGPSPVPSQSILGSHPGGSYTLGSALSTSGQTSQDSEHSTMSNGTTSYPRPSGWGSGATMADIVKASVALPPPPPADIKMPPLPSLPSNEPQVLQPSSGGLYASSSDPVLHPSLDPRTSGPQTSIKRDVGIVGNQRPIGERTVSPLSHLDSNDSLNTHSLLSVTHPMSSSAVASVNTEPGADVHASHTMFSSDIPSESVSAEPSESSANRTELEGSLEVSSLSSRGQSVIGPVQRNIPHPSDEILSYSSPNTQGLDWKSGLGQTSSADSDHLETSQEASEKDASVDSGLSAANSKIQGLSLQEETPVIIPGHLQVPEADRTRLSFGSFGAGFGSSFGSGFGSDEPQETRPSTAENDATDASANLPNPISAISPPASENQNYIQTTSTVNDIQSPSTNLEDSQTKPIQLVTQSQLPTSQSQLSSQQQEESSQSQQNQSLSQPQGQSQSAQSHQMSIQPPQQQTSQQQPQPSQQHMPTQQQQPIQQQGVQPPQPTTYPFMPTVQNYPAFGLLTQMPGNQFNNFDGSDSQNSDASRLSGMGLNMPYGDPASYYSPLLRPSPETESRYTPFSANPAQKYPLGTATAGMMQGLSASQDVNVSGMGSGSGNLSSQTSNLTQSNPSMTQQPLPIHAAYATQPPGIPLNAHYSTLGYAGYTPYLHPSYYMQSPYSHTNYPPANTAYGQAPAGSSYPPSAMGNFPSTATPSLKYPLPQFKGSNAGSATPLSGVYAAYANPSSYNAIPSVSPANSAGYDDVGGQYKDGNMFIPNQMNRDLSGVQNSSYYNLSQQQPQQQQQHSAYSHNTQQATNLQTPFSNSLYHPSPSGPSNQSHQMMQQPITNSGGSAQPVGYQQQPRSQQGWNSGF